MLNAKVVEFEFPIRKVWRDNKIAIVLLVGLVLHILTLFSPLSNKAVNNVFYIGILLPVLLLTRWSHLQSLFQSHIVKAATIYGLYTCIVMALTLEAGKFKYWLYALALVLTFYHLSLVKLLDAKLFAYGIGLLVLIYATIHLLWYYMVDGHSLSSRPWFHGWQLFVPTYLTAYLSVIFAASSGYLINQKHYFITFSLLGILVFIFILTKSRMGLVGLLAATPFFVALLVTQNGYRPSFKSLGFTLFFFTLLGVLYLNGIFEPLTARGESYRPLIWKAAWSDAVGCGIWLGCGYDYLFQVVTGSATQITEHSIYFSQLLRSGLVGLALLLILISMTIVAGWKARTPWLLAFVAGSACLTVEGQSLMAQPRAITQFLFWIPFSMIVVSDVRLRSVRKTKVTTDSY